MRGKFFMIACGMTLAMSATASTYAQTSTVDAGYGGYPTPLPYSNAPGSYVVAPSMPGSGGSYAYVQQYGGTGYGGSPNAYYSSNFFTSTPMTPNYANGYRAGYSGSYSPNNYSSYYAAPGTGAWTPAGTTYSTGTGSYYYYPNTSRRVGPFRRLWGAR